jgi:molybdopterin/thiamine biosynthesis adenylyltransferase
VASAEVSTVDQASLDAFRGELIEAGFEPRKGDRREWIGPIAEPLKALTEAQTMRIRIEDGWPYRPPTLFVEGIDSDHAVYDGELCLYQAGDDSMEWTTLAGYQERLDSWVKLRPAGFRPEDELLDAHLFFRPTLRGAVATLEISSLPFENNSGVAAELGPLYGHVGDGGHVLALSPTRPAGHHLGGRWYYLSESPAVPPRNLEAVVAALSTRQRPNFERRLANVGAGEKMILTLFWETQLSGRNGLILLGDLDESGEVRIRSVELAPTDTKYRLMRAGPDVDLLGQKSVAVFGVGAIGSNFACRLAESGLGALTLIDGQCLRPSNFIRHAGVPVAGMAKVSATEAQIQMRAPWTEVTIEPYSPWSESELLPLVESSELLVEATGSAAFAELLARIAAVAKVPLISAALYGGGATARIRRQATDEDVRLAERIDEKRFPKIPAGEDPLPNREPGCAAAINNAAPVSVAAIAATAAEIAIDTLTGRFEMGEETIDVYRPLEKAPFDSIGRLGG